MNILDISISEEVFKWDKSKDFNDMQLKNIEIIYLIEEVFTFDKLNDFSETHSKNILFIIVTEEKSRLSRLTDINEVHLSNIWPIFVIDKAFIFDKSTLIIFFKFLNIALASIIEVLNIIVTLFISFSKLVTIFPV